MWGVLISWALKILTSLVGIFSAPKPNEAENLAKEAGRAEVVASVDEKANAEIQSVSDARDHADAGIQSADGLHKFEQSDPNNRHDN